jgi:hypothetical protein
MSLLRKSRSSCGCSAGSVSAAAPVFVSGNVQLSQPPSGAPAAAEPSETPRAYGPEPSSDFTPTL